MQDVDQMLLDLGLELDVTTLTVTRKVGKDTKVYFQTADGLHTFTGNSVKRYVTEELITVAKVSDNTFTFTANEGVRLVKVDADGFSGYTNKGASKVSEIAFV